MEQPEGEGAVVEGGCCFIEVVQEELTVRVGGGGNVGGRWGQSGGSEGEVARERGRLGARVDWEVPGARL